MESSEKKEEERTGNISTPLQQNFSIKPARETEKILHVLMIKFPNAKLKSLTTKM